MSDFLPGYVNTLCDPRFDIIKKNLIVFGKENGKIYCTFDTKEELFEKLKARKSRMFMMCYCQNIEMTKAEREMIWGYNVIYMDETNKKRVRESIGQTLVQFAPRKYK